MSVSFAFHGDITKMPLRFWKRISIRNSKIREEISGLANQERIWAMGFDMTFEWGSFNKMKPSRVGTKTRLPAPTVPT